MKNSKDTRTKNRTTKTPNPNKKIRSDVVKGFEFKPSNILSATNGHEDSNEPVQARGDKTRRKA
jgi:hypothetical protein